MAGVEADFPTSNCFCYLIMSQAGKHPPPCLVSLGPPSLPAQGKFPGTKIRLPDAASDFRAPDRILQTATPGQLFGTGMGDGAGGGTLWSPVLQDVLQPRSPSRSGALPGPPGPGLLLHLGFCREQCASSHNTLLFPADDGETEAQNSQGSCPNHSV